MKTNHTDITIILDRSGSMAPLVKDTIGGFNRFISDQKKVVGTATLTLHQFNHDHETPIKASDIQSVSDLTASTYVPSGNTALLDALGGAITETGRRLDVTPEAQRPGKVVVVVITDGEENCSREYTRPQVFDLIQHQQKKYSWEFVFLGANQDAIKAGARYGFMASNSMNYAANDIGTDTLYRCVSSKLSDFRTKIGATMAFTSQEREEQVKAGAMPGTVTTSATDDTK